ncbi:MAG: TlpA disulfide reductase family protein [Saprospiraceae bacterium]
MKLRINLCLIIAATPHLVSMAQSNAVHIMEKVNERILAKETGFFEIQGLWKSATSDDTTKQKGEVVFFRKETSNPDSICAFILSRDGQQQEAFDGQTYFDINHKLSKIVTWQPQKERGVRDMIRGGYRHRWAFPSFLVANGKAPFTLTKFEQAKVDTALVNGSPWAIIQVLDKSVNEHKLNISDPEMMTVKEVYEVSLEDYSLRRLVQEVHFWSSPQYEEFIFSPIVSMPDSTTFFQVFKLDSLLASGFELTEKKPRTLAPPPDGHIKPGASLNLPALIGPQGDTIDLKSTQSKLLLLDFWFRGCPPCIQSMPTIENIFKKYKASDLAVFGINKHDRDVANFLISRQISYPPCLIRTRPSPRALALFHTRRSF